MRKSRKKEEEKKRNFRRNFRNLTWSYLNELTWAKWLIWYDLLVWPDQLMSYRLDILHGRSYWPSKNILHLWKNIFWMTWSSDIIWLIRWSGWSANIVLKLECCHVRMDLLELEFSSRYIYPQVIILSKLTSV